MKKLFFLLLALATAVFAQHSPSPSSSDGDEAKLAPPPMVSSWEGRPLYRVTGEIKPPKVVTAPDPPPLKDFSAGKVILWCIVGQDGTAHMIKVAKHYTLEADMKAVENLKQWKFKPGKLKNDDVDVLMTVDVVWH